MSRRRGTRSGAAAARSRAVARIHQNRPVSPRSASFGRHQSRVDNLPGRIGQRSTSYDERLHNSGMQHQSSVANARREALGGSAMAGIFGAQPRVRTAAQRDAPQIDRWEKASHHAQRPMTSLSSEATKLSPLPGVHVGARAGPDMFSPKRNGATMNASNGHSSLSPQQQYALDLQQQIRDNEQRRNQTKMDRGQLQSPSNRVSNLRQTVQSSRIDTARSRCDTARSRMLSGSAMAGCLGSGGGAVDVRPQTHASNDAFGGMLPSRVRATPSPLQQHHQHEQRQREQLLLQQQQQQREEEQREQQRLLQHQQRQREHEQRQREQQPIQQQRDHKQLHANAGRASNTDTEELEFLRMENLRLTETNVEMRQILDRYYSLYGPLPAT